MNKTASKKIDFLDERKGYWTSFEIDQQQIIFRKSRPNSHWLVSSISFLIVATTVLGLLQNPFGIITLIFAVYLIVSGWRDTQQTDQNRFPILIAADFNTAKDKYCHGRIFSKRDVRKVIVRENKNREHSDSHLIQIYLQLKSSDYLVLVHQNYWTPAAEQSAEEIAQQFRDWLS